MDMVLQVIFCSITTYSISHILGVLHSFSVKLCQSHYENLKQKSMK